MLPRMDIPTNWAERSAVSCPSIISIVCYFGCFFWMEYRNTPRVISIIVVVALAIQMVCAFINIWWKISTHTAAIGGVAGGSGI